MAEYHIREANREDAIDMARVRVATWRAAYKGILPDEFLEDLSYEQVGERWKQAFWENREPGVATFVAQIPEKEIIGIAICGPEQSRDARYQSEIYVLYVLPQYQGQGIGRALVFTCVQYLSQQLRAKTMLIWVIAENPYRRFYESLGGKVVRQKEQEIGGKLIAEVGYGWQDIEKQIPA